MRPEAEKRILWETKVNGLFWTLPMSMVLYWVGGAFNLNNTNLNLYSAKNGQWLYGFAIVLAVLMFWFSTRVACYQAANTDSKLTVKGLFLPLGLITITMVITTQTAIKAHKAANIERTIQRAELLIPAEHKEEIQLLRKLETGYAHDFHGLRWEDVTMLIKNVSDATQKYEPNY